MSLCCDYHDYSSHVLAAKRCVTLLTFWDYGKGMNSKALVVHKHKNDK